MVGYYSTVEMDPEAFEAGGGAVESGSKAYLYHVPEPPLRSLELTPKLVQQLSSADHQLGRLASLADLIPNPHLLISPYVRREAVMSSRIEGTRADLTDVYMEEAGEADASRPKDAREVVNYVRALEHGIEEIDDRPIDLDLLRELHRILLQDVRGDEMGPGRWRTTQNWIGPPGSDLDGATYVPPAPDRLSDCLAEMERYLHDPPPLPPLLRVGIAHYYFEAVHPFADGNGRVGRLLIVLRLMEEGLLPEPLLYLSAFFHERKDTYYDALMRVSQEGDYHSWLRFFLEGVETQSRDAVERAGKLVHLRQRYREALLDMDATPTTLQVLDALFARPVISIPEAADTMDVTYPTAKKAIEEYLVEAGILEEFTGKKRNRRYAAPRILDILEG